MVSTSQTTEIILDNATQYEDDPTIDHQPDNRVPHIMCQTIDLKIEHPSPTLSQRLKVLCTQKPDRKLNPIKSINQYDRPIALVVGWYLSTSIRVGLPVSDMELHWQEGLEASLQFRLALILCDPVMSGIHFCCPASYLEASSLVQDAGLEGCEVLGLHSVCSALWLFQG
ncbi:hypothetical protein BDV39DRAFT_208297 [Aspergillus sergii]|uniref:Uncharacterized protein n=1 Tax=Aspergillus sergii TaxID=1034303 RepID=A0A5N6WSS3_9EURO|nr:hypothetical protein BDV39DRAFT_208297 [Aspergillus sergii]